MVAAGTGSFRRFERFSLMLVVGSLLLVPVFLMVHPPVGAMAADFFVPKLPEAEPVERGDAADHRHRRHDGRAVAAVFSAELRHRQAHYAAFHPLRAGGSLDRHRLRDGGGRRADGGCGSDIRGPSRIRRCSAMPAALHPGSKNMSAPLPAVLFALALLDACIIGASAVSLSTAYAVERRARPAPLVAPQADRGKGILRRLLRSHCTGGGAGAYPGHAARSV